MSDDLSALPSSPTQDIFVKVKIEIVNTGQSTAISTLYDAVMPSGLKHASDGYLHVCDVPVANSLIKRDDGVERGFALAPGQSILMEKTPSMSIRAGNFGSEPAGPVFIFVCAIYRDEFSIKHRVRSCFETNHTMDGVLPKFLACPWLNEST